MTRTRRGVSSYTHRHGEKDPAEVTTMTTNAVQIKETKKKEREYYGIPPPPFPTEEPTGVIHSQWDHCVCVSVSCILIIIPLAADTRNKNNIPPLSFRLSRPSVNFLHLFTLEEKHKTKLNRRVIKTTIKITKSR